MTAGQEWVLGDVRLHDIMQRDGWATLMKLYYSRDTPLVNIIIINHLDDIAPNRYQGPGGF
jgi:hypothetical protein